MTQSSHKISTMNRNHRSLNTPQRCHLNLSLSLSSLSHAHTQQSISHIEAHCLDSTSPLFVLLLALKTLISNPLFSLTPRSPVAPISSRPASPRPPFANDFQPRTDLKVRFFWTTIPLAPASSKIRRNELLFRVFVPSLCSIARLGATS